MNISIGAVLVRAIEQYRAAHPEEAAAADQLCKDYKPFSEIEPAIFSIDLMNNKAEDGECGKRKPITNYDRIVSKLPKERALLLSETCPPGSGCLVCKDYTDVISGNRRCDLCWIDWLKKEAT